MTANIYLWRNTVTNKVYIGKTCNAKVRHDWFLDFETHYAGPHIDKARRKYNDKKYWEYKILYTLEGNDRKELNEQLNKYEIEFIKKYNSNDKYKGYNISSGGTWGDTFAALTEEEKHKRVTKQSKSHKRIGYRWMNKDLEEHKIPNDQQEYYLAQGWIYGRSKKTKELLSNSIKNSEKCKEVWESFRLSPEEIERRKIEAEEKKRQYRESEEYKLKKEINRQRSSEIITKYNKSKEHREAAIRSNLNRWKNGCPEETRKKMSKSIREAYAKRGKSIWMNNGIDTKMIKLNEVNKYIADGWHKGRK